MDQEWTSIGDGSKEGNGNRITPTNLIRHALIVGAKLHRIKPAATPAGKPRPVEPARHKAEVTGHPPRTFSNSQVFDQLRVGVEQVSFDPLGDRPFDREQRPSDRGGRRDGKHDEMIGLRHLDESDQLESSPTDGPVDGLTGLVEPRYPEWGTATIPSQVSAPHACGDDPFHHDGLLSMGLEGFEPPTKRL